VRVPLRLLIPLAAAIGWAYGATLSQLVTQWARDENYSHGFVVLPFAAYVVWQRRDALPATDIAPSNLGLAFMLVSAGLFVAGQLGAEIFFTRVSLVGMLAGIVGFVWGRAHLRLLAFPIAFLLFMIPLPSIVFNQITLPLQFVASSLGETIIRAAGVPVLRDGNVLQLASGNLEVVAACSGIRSLVSLMMVAVIIAFWRNAGTWSTLLVSVTAAPVAIITNALRVAGTGLASNWLGPAAAEGFFHTFTGLVMFGTALAAMLTVAEIIARLPQLRPWAAARVRGLA
jgi:exosortase